MYLLDLLEGRREKRQCDLVCAECLWLMSYSSVMSVVLILSEVGPVLRSRYGIE